MDLASAVAAIIFGAAIGYGIGYTKGSGNERRAFRALLKTLLVTQSERVLGAVKQAFKRLDNFDTVIQTRGLTRMVRSHICKEWSAANETNSIDEAEGDAVYPSEYWDTAPAMTGSLAELERCIGATHQLIADVTVWAKDMNAVRDATPYDRREREASDAINNLLPELVVLLNTVKTML